MAFMRVSLPLDEVTPGAYRALLDLLRVSRSTSRRAQLPADIRELVCVRASQLNGCEVCLDVHIPLAVRAGVAREKLAALEKWRDTPANGAVQWTEAELAALDLAERLTLTADPRWGNKTELAQAVARSADVFSREQIAALEWTVVTINSFNRVSILGDL